MNSSQKSADNKNSISIDFLSAQLNYRKQRGGGRKQLIAKAVGIKSGYRPKIIDATAGLGIDAFILASLGCEVTMLERSPIIGALLEDGLLRAKEQLESSNIKLNLVIADAREFLTTLSPKQYPDVIYLDPMYPERRKSALNKKNMRMLRDIVGEDLDSWELLAVAIKVATKRVVVKRPRLAPAIAPPKADIKPDIVYRGKSCRFDVYVKTGK
jgi:16S rRNA (guanine1516-N2)-methyltransferase